MFKNKEGLSFDDVRERPADQEIDLVTDPRGEVQYPLKTAKLSIVKGTKGIIKATYTLMNYF